MLPLYVRGGLTEGGPATAQQRSSQLADSDSSLLSASDLLSAPPTGQTWPEPEGEGDSVCPGHPPQVWSRAEMVEGRSSEDQPRIANPEPSGQLQAVGGTLTLWKMPHSRNLVVILWIATFLDIPALIHFSEIIN